MKVRIDDSSGMVKVEKCGREEYSLEMNGMKRRISGNSHSATQVTKK